jgi:hypothetical protein
MHRCRTVSLLLALCVASAATAGDLFDRYFTPGTLRVDYYHTGTKGAETISLDGAVQEGTWAGSRTNLVDTLNLGEYLVRVYDRATNVLLYSRGFSSMFNEWQTTDEAGAGVYRTFHESVRCPMPRGAVQVSLSRRDRRMQFHEVFATVIEPGQVVREKRPAPFAVTPIMENGPAATSVDLVLLGDGYTEADLPKLRNDARHFTEAMFATKPFSAHRREFNVRLVESVSAESGIDVPDKNVWKKTALATRYNTFGSARYVLTEDNRAVRDAAALAPYDFICILVNDERYGGGGIFQQYTTTYTGEPKAGEEWREDYVYVHEFGHAFGGLGDEYYSSSTAYNEFYPAGVEPWEPNVTALGDKANLKWTRLTTAGTAVPTPWEKATYDSLEAVRGTLDRLAPDYYQKQRPLYQASMDLLKTSRFAGQVGAFEGAGYASKGLYRPAIDCRMFSLSLIDFDPVCGAAIETMIDFYTH